MPGWATRAAVPTRCAPPTASELGRRRLLLAAAGSSLLGGCAAFAPTAAPLRPPRLRPGDTVGLFASATRMTEAWIEQAVASVESLGLRPRLGRQVRAVDGHYAGTVRQRVDDLHELWADPQVRALWSIRGGAGTAQLLPHLDYVALRRNPKAVIGFSDVTALLLALWRHAGLVGFHAAAGAGSFSAYTAQALRTVLMEPQAQTRFELSPDQRTRAVDDPQYRARTVRGGVAEGRLVGGNLSVLSALVGTPFGPQTEGALLFLEDVRELPYRVDRMLTQLELAGLLRASAGIAGGVFRDCESPPGEGGMPLAQAIDARFGSAGVPATYGLSFGHVRDQMVLPVGLRARLDADALTLTLLEPAVT